MTARFAYENPRTLEEAFRLRESAPGARFVAGGTDLLVKIRHGAVRAETLISLRNIPGLSGIEVGEKTRIGALTTIDEIAEDAGLAEHYPSLSLAARAVGSQQIRNVATLGGNLCNAAPCADTAPPLLVHEARAIIRGASGERVLPIAELFVGPGAISLESGEILVALELDAPRPGDRSTFRKKGRVAMDVAIVNVAVLLEMDGATCRRARVCAGSVAPVPLRLRGVEALLEGARLDEARVTEAAAKASSEVAPITDIRATAEYRRHLVGVFVTRACHELMGLRSAS